MPEPKTMWSNFKMFLQKFKIIMNFWRKEENLYQISNIIKKSENFIIGVYYDLEYHGINQISMSFFN